MNVIILVPDLRHEGGVTNYYKCLSLNIEKNIKYMYVNTFSRNRSPNYGLSKILIIIKKSLFLPYIYLKFLFTAVNYQLVHVNPSLNYKSFYRDMVFIFISRLLDKKILIFFRGWEDQYEKKIRDSSILTFLFRNTYARADNFIVLGHIFKEKLITLGVNEGKRFYIETTIADDRYLQDIDIERKIKSYENGVNLLFLSRIVKDKGVYIAIDAFINCKENIKNYDLKLYVAGDGDELELVKSYVKKNKYKNIEFTGYVIGEKKRDLLLKSHIMIFPTYYGEGLPNCILEGMLYGMPIVSRVNGGIPDIVENNVNGFLNESTEYFVYADYCLELIQDKHLYERIARCNYKKASENFVTDVVRKRLLNIYNDLRFDRKEHKLRT